MGRLLILVSLLILAGCGGGGSSGVVDESSSKFARQNKSIDIDSSKRVYRITNAKDSTLELNIKEPKDIYVVVSSKFNNQKVSVDTKSYSYTDNKDIDFSSANRVLPFPFKKVDTILMRKEINNILFDKSLTPNYRLTNESNRTINDISNYSSANFCIGMDSNHKCTSYISASSKKVIKDIQTPFGTKSLVIWLEKGNSLSQDSIDKLADIFLKSGPNNDIYDWETNIFGEEWESNANVIDSKLIAKSDIIDILIYDMNNISLAGYFWGKDNFKKSAIEASNEKIMFYINSELLKKDPKETYTTLVHEFQHMIHFYQRSVVKGIEDSAWYDELMAESIEDLLSTKIGYKGPRNVDPNDGSAGEAGNRGGRYPNFNRYNSASLTTWQNSPADYSKVSAFGTYLLRNYGGANLLNRMMFSNNQDEYAILDATGESNFGDLIANWGSAVILSDIINAEDKYRYNFGDFKYVDFNGITYELGSINFFNYTPNPQFRSSAILDKNANLYYKLGSNLRGSINLNVSLPIGGDITIIAK